MSCKPNHHAHQDYQSLLLHQEAVRMLKTDPSLREQLLSILSDWETHVSHRSRPLREKWAQIIQERNWSLAVEESERANQLRQASPMASLLPNAVRFAVIRRVRMLKDQRHV